MPEPELGDYDARCEMLYGATCTGTDSHIIAGKFPWLSPLPTVLGHESVGRVVELGRKVRNYRIGDIVTRVGTPPAAGISVNWGGFAEVGIAVDHWAMCSDGLPAAEWKPHRWNQVLPAGVDPRVGPMFITWRETLSFMQRFGVGAGASILVIGSGGNGLSFAAHARNMDAARIVMTGSARLRDAVMSRGLVHAYLDYRGDEWQSALKEIAAGGFDFIVDAIGRTGVADIALPLLKPGGKYSTYGIDDIGKIVMNPKKARGAFTVHPASYDESETHQEVSELALQGRLDASLWYDVESPYPLDSIAAAFDDIIARRKSPKALIRL
jgi:D-arabinose 1-dehydrogenase-like Zn-dependent alcohol dehydrogenase